MHLSTRNQLKATVRSVEQQVYGRLMCGKPTGLPTHWKPELFG
ncbi:hypothetical protein EDD64_10118 [Effusibacillus lacus]|nr:hypothetical protein EDD64_10118 [Effusibacillus lacus]